MPSPSPLPVLSSPRRRTCRSLWSALVMAVLLVLLIAPRAAHSQTSAWTVVDYVSYSKPNTTDIFGRLLWKNTNGRYAIWNLGVDGKVVKGIYVTPPAGYTLKQFYVPTYNSPEVFLLWDSPATRKCVIWTVNSDLTSITPNREIIYPTTTTLPGFIAYNPSAQTIYLSWNPPNGSFFFWSVNLSTGLPYNTSPSYGPYAGFKASKFTYYRRGFGSYLYLGMLMLSTSGKQVNLIEIDGGGVAAAPKVYGPYATVTPYAISGDRMMWIYDSGRIALWQFEFGTWNITNSRVLGPIVGVTPVSFSLDNNGFTHVLWKYENGKAALWTLSQQMQNINAGYTYGPIY